MSEEEDNLPVFLAENFEVLPGDQQELFGPCDYPEQPTLVKACKEYIHTGKIVLKDQGRCEAVMSALIAGVPVTTVMRTYRIGYQSIRRIEAALEAAGKLETLKQREQRQLMNLGALAKERLTQRLLDGKVQDNVAAVVMGISYQRAGEMGSGEIEPESKGEDRGDPEAWAKRFQALKNITARAPIDVQSTENSEESQ
tara:strand:+ start:933 stop:1526 length:594 start_codon:yes stop_codon:yes gene_type:complete